MDNDALKHSVLAGDVNQSGVSVLNYFTPLAFSAAITPLKDIIDPTNPQSDFILRRTMYYESYWAAALAITTSKMSSLAFEVKDATPLRAKRAQEMLLDSNLGEGWTHFISHIVQDYTCCNNGLHVEVIRKSSAKGSQVLGIAALDSARCTRTGDPERPILYRDLNGAEHELKYYQVFSMADLPSPASTFFGVGFCAAARAYNIIRTLAAVQRYNLEKITGSNPLAIDFITGITETQLNSALSTQDNERRSRGMVTYRGTVIIPFMQKEGINHVRIPLAELPDNFDREKELNAALLGYANCLGLDPQELQPLTGQPLGSGMQSEELANKAKGKGLVSFKQGFTHKLKKYALPKSTAFLFMERDYRDQLLKAQVAQARATFIDVIIKDGVIKPVEGRQLLIDSDDLPREFLPATGDLTPSESLSDTDNLDAEQIIQPASGPAFRQVTTKDYQVMLSKEFYFQLKEKRPELNSIELNDLWLSELPTLATAWAELKTSGKPDEQIYSLLTQENN